jgi:hypothetical protein
MKFTKFYFLEGQNYYKKFIMSTQNNLINITGSAKHRRAQLYIYIYIVLKFLKDRKIWPIKSLVL